jgi:mono/diheme cytochrome c family protein
MLLRLIFISAALLLLLAAAFGPDPLPAWATYIPKATQRTGNPAKGYDYLVYGDYVSSGAPLGAFRKFLGKREVNDLGRTGDSKGIPFSFNVVETVEGAKMVAPTCLTCHAQTLMDTLIVGLGAISSDYSSKQKGVGLAKAVFNMQYGKDSPEMAAFARTLRAHEALSGRIVTETPGLNPADKIFAVLSAYRDPQDLHWLEEPQFDIPKEALPTDVPPWWNVKKKHMLYYNGLGRGDFARLSMAAGLLTMTDSTEARRIDGQMTDVMAWINTLEPPKYPFPVNRDLAEKGKVIFEKTCSKCHGTYGETETYPNLVIDVEKVGTDPHLAQVYHHYPEYHTWFNNSWFAADSNTVWARLLPTHGYVAPPLDGIWATAPYFHNASVPTVWDVLDPQNRPMYWEKPAENPEYDPQRLGWRVKQHDKRGKGSTYDTTLPGYGNQGHPFGEKLNPEERKAVVEYLKTL